MSMLFCSGDGYTALRALDIAGDSSNWVRKEKKNEKITRTFATDIVARWEKNWSQS